jgi:hypothetical protein
MSSPCSSAEGRKTPQNPAQPEIEAGFSAVFFGGYLPEGETAKNCEKLRIEIPNFPELKGGQMSAKVRMLTVGIGGYLIDVEPCLFFKQCWAGCIQFWIIYQLALGVCTALSEGPSKTNGVAKGVAKNGVWKDKEKRVTAL